MKQPSDPGIRDSGVGEWFAGWRARAEDDGLEDDDEP
jgi:hypothetical protein